MANLLENKLVVAITSRALFELDEAHRIYEQSGLDAYRQYQISHENEPLKPGTGFPLVKALLSINQQIRQRNPKLEEDLVEIVLISRNDADSGFRIIKSIEANGLTINRSAFTGGSEAWPYLQPFSVDLFLSAHEDDVRAALREGFAAGLVCTPPAVMDDDCREVRIAFDGDAVLFSDESEQIYAEKGLPGFQKHERANSDNPMNEGPFKSFLEALGMIQGFFGQEDCPIRTYLVTARSAPADKRAVHTLRQWGVRINEAFFLGGIEKAGVLRKIRPHIFFDDQQIHTGPASKETPAALVLYGIKNR